MAVEVHPRALVEDGAELGDGVRIGAFAYIASSVRLGDGCTVHQHASVEGNTILGGDSEVFPYACIGGKSQDRKKTGGSPGLIIGRANIFREYCTVNTHSEDGKFTRIGSHNYCLAYSHIAHNCVVGDHFTLGHNSTLGGHVIVGDHAGTGGHVAVHPFCRLGRYSYLGGCSKVVQDIPPYMLADGSPVVVRTINRVGLERADFAREDLKLVHQVYKALYREGLNRTQALERLRKLERADSPIVERMIAFIESSERGIA